VITFSVVAAILMASLASLVAPLTRRPHPSASVSVSSAARQRDRRRRVQQAEVEAEQPLDLRIPVTKRTPLRLEVKRPRAPVRRG